MLNAEIIYLLMKSLKYNNIVYTFTCLIDTNILIFVLLLAKTD